MVSTTDWREQGQERYLKGLVFRKARYRRLRDTWEHDHCEFCWSKFCEDEGSPDCLGVGYTTHDWYRWICERCFLEFEVKYDLRLEAGTSGSVDG